MLLQNIKGLNENFVKVLNSIDQKYLQIEALDNESLDAIDRINKYHQGKEIKGEQNANAGNETSPSGRIHRAYEPYEKLKSYNMLFNQMEQDYGTKLACAYIKELLQGVLLLHDSANVDLPYCVAYSSNKLMREGRIFAELDNVDPKNSRSFIHSAIESLFDCAKEFAGATVIHDLLVNLAWYTQNERNAMYKACENLSLQQTKEILAFMIVNTQRDYTRSLSKLEKLQSKKECVDYVKNKEIENLLQGFVHICNNSWRGGDQSLFVNLSLFPRKILRDFFKNHIYPNGDGIEEYIEEIINIQLIFSKFFAEGIRGLNGKETIASFPVVTLSLLDNEDIKDPNTDTTDYDEDDVKFIDQVLMDFSKYQNINVFMGVRIATCCRLLNERGESSNVEITSLGTLTSMSDSNEAFGSLRVATLNYARIALDLKLKNMLTEKNYLKAVEKYMSMTKDILNSQRKLILQRDKEGFFKLSKAGWVNLSKLASTFGGLGTYQAQKMFSDSKCGYLTDEEITFGNNILKFVDIKCKNYSEKYGVNFNSEISVPGESGFERMAKRDIIMHGDNCPYETLSNQFVDNSAEITLEQKLDGENRMCSVVSTSTIAHLNIEGSMTPEQSVRFHRKIWEQYPYLQHYAVNNNIYTCENNHTECKKTTNGKCIHCGGEIVSISSRVIGYYKPIKNYSKARRKEHASRTRFEI